MPAAVAAALGIHDLPVVAAADALAHALARRQLLLVLDNCEQVIGAAAEVCGRLLLGADDVRVLATSRESLRIAGEAPVPARSADPARPENPGNAGNPGYPGKPSGPGQGRIRGGDAVRRPRPPGGAILHPRSTDPQDRRRAGGAAGRDAARDRAGRGPGGRARRDAAAGPDRRPVRAAGGRRPAGRTTPAVPRRRGALELRAARRRRAKDVPRPLGVPRPLHPGRGRGGGRTRCRAGRAAAGGPLAAGPATGRSRRPDQVRHAGDTARLRGRPAGRGRRGRRSHRRAGRIRGRGGRTGFRRLVHPHRGGGQPAAAGRRGCHPAPRAGLGDGARPRHGGAACAQPGAVVEHPGPPDQPGAGAGRGRRVRRGRQRRVVRRADAARPGRQLCRRSGRGHGVLRHGRQASSRTRPGSRRGRGPCCCRSAWAAGRWP